MITTETIKYLEGLVKIRLTEDKREKYKLELSNIINYIEEISSIDLADLKPDHSHKNIFKSDEVIESAGHTKRALANTSSKVGNLYKVAQVIKQ